MQYQGGHVEEAIRTEQIYSVTRYWIDKYLW
jgi:hypothetical protein